MTRRDQTSHVPESPHQTHFLAEMSGFLFTRVSPVVRASAFGVGAPGVPERHAQNRLR